MKNRIHSQPELQTILVELLGSSNVYYQPPESLKMSYPCIRYSTNEIDSMRADNRNYVSTKGYNIVVISKKPDEPVISKILERFPMCTYDRHYVSDNLNHDVIRLFF